jgi:two-component system, cell cycle sensor histidine kinase and response regulator CckA
VASLLGRLGRLVGTECELTWTPGAGDMMVSIDMAQLDQILAALCQNARDACQNTGRHADICLKSVRDYVDADHAPADAEPGEYVVLKVADNGRGITADMREQLFEPFFTTKPASEGAGLGLATVYGIVRQNKGFIHVYSEPGKGSTFCLYLPRDTSVREDATQGAAKTDCQGGTETILLVEDEPAIRFTIRMFLERFGYTVIAAQSPAEALRLASEHRDGIDLLLTDVVMPGMSGRELADKLLRDVPSMKILYMSGYTADVITHRGILQEGVQFISKPVSRDALAQKVRDVLG